MKPFLYSCIFILIFVLDRGTGAYGNDSLKIRNTYSDAKVLAAVHKEYLQLQGIMEKYASPKINNAAILQELHVMGIYSGLSATNSAADIESFFNNKVDSLQYLYYNIIGDYFNVSDIMNKLDFSSNPFMNNEFNLINAFLKGSKGKDTSYTSILKALQNGTLYAKTDLDIQSDFLRQSGDTVMIRQGRRISFMRLSDLNIVGSKWHSRSRPGIASSFYKDLLDTDTIAGQAWPLNVNWIMTIADTEDKNDTLFDIKSIAYVEKGKKITYYRIIGAPNADSLRFQRVVNDTENRVAYRYNKIEKGDVALTQKYVYILTSRPVVKQYDIVSPDNIFPEERPDFSIDSIRYYVKQKFGSLKVTTPTRVNHTEDTFYLDNAFINAADSFTVDSGRLRRITLYYTAAQYDSIKIENNKKVKQLLTLNSRMSVYNSSLRFDENSTALEKSATVGTANSSADLQSAAINGIASFMAGRFRAEAMQYGLEQIMHRIEGEDSAVVKVMFPKTFEQIRNLYSVHKPNSYYTADLLFLRQLCFNDLRDMPEHVVTSDFVKRRMMRSPLDYTLLSMGYNIVNYVKKGYALPKIVQQLYRNTDIYADTFRYIHIPTSDTSADNSYNELYRQLLTEVSFVKAQNYPSFKEYCNTLLDTFRFDIQVFNRFLQNNHIDVPDSFPKDTVVLWSRIRKWNIHKGEKCLGIDRDGNLTLLGRSENQIDYLGPYLKASVANDYIKMVNQRILAQQDTAKLLPGVIYLLSEALRDTSNGRLWVNPLQSLNYDSNDVSNLTPRYFYLLFWQQMTAAPFLKTFLSKEVMRGDVNSHLTGLETDATVISDKIQHLLLFVNKFSAAYNLALNKSNTLSDSEKYFSYITYVSTAFYTLLDNDLMKSVYHLSARQVKSGQKFLRIMIPFEQQRYETAISNLIVELSEYLPDARHLNYLKSINFLTQLVLLKKESDFKNLLEAYALPIGSSSIKRTGKWNISLNGYVGATGGLETAYGTTGNQTKFNIGLAAPIGISFTHNRWTAFLSIIDLGSVVNARLNNDTTAYSGLKFQQFLAPGLGVFYNVPKAPVSLGLQYSYIHNLRNIKLSNGAVQITETNLNVSRVNFSVLIDIPFFTLYNVDKEKIEN